jgi:hypothetical protein
MKGIKKINVAQNMSVIRTGRQDYNDATQISTSMQTDYPCRQLFQVEIDMRIGNRSALAA